MNTIIVKAVFYIHEMEHCYTILKTNKMKRLSFLLI